MSKRPCLDCKRPTTGTRCRDCARIKDRARGSREDRGYGQTHRRLRADWQRRLDAGERVTCWRCEALGKPHLIDPADWQLGHDDFDRSVYRGPECSSGNQATSGRYLT